MTKQAQRPQDYEAMVEENRRLAARVAELEKQQLPAKKPKPPRAPGAFRRWFADDYGPTLRGGATIAGAVLVGIILFSIYAAGASIKCYSLEAPPPQRPFLGWKIIPHMDRLGCGNAVKDGLDEEQAHAFVAKWKLTVCR